MTIEQSIRVALEYFWLLLGPLIYLHHYFEGPAKYGRYIPSTGSKTSQELSTSTASRQPRSKVRELRVTTDDPRNFRNDVGWFLMESPSFFTMMFLILLTPFFAPESPFPEECVSIGECLLIYYEVRWKPLLLCILFTLHYFNRSILYPARMVKGSHRKMSKQILLQAAAFCLINAYINGRSLLMLNDYDLVGPQGRSIGLLGQMDTIAKLRFWFGLMLWNIGFGINVFSDAFLRSLRPEKSKSPFRQEYEYSIPRGFLFEFVSCPNYLGEIIEWCGWTIACGFTKASLGFAMVTIGNLSLRAYYHHQWYLDKFDEYKTLNRKALIPSVW